MSALVPNFLRFAQLLRGLGIAVAPDQILLTLEAVNAVGLERRGRFKQAARSILVGRREHLDLFDQAFDLFWRPGSSVPSIGLGTLRQHLREVKVQSVLLGPSAGEEKAREDEGEEEHHRPWTASEREVLRHKSFAELLPEELAEVRRLLRETLLAVAPRRTRRFRPARRGSALDLSRTLRRSFATGGEPIELARRSRRDKARPVVALADISGSMELYSRLLLELLFVLGRTSERFEAFVFGTRLTRVTRPLARRDPDRALNEATAAVRDWGGGTRIGDALKEFNFRWGKRLLGQGAVVLVISDGWDRGDPELLEREAARLARSAGRLIWLSPLLGVPGYEPIQRGIAAVLPHVDDFLPVHNLESLSQLAEILALASRGSAARRLESLQR